MKRVIIILLLVSSFGSAWAQNETNVFSLDDCINYALQYNQDVETAELETYIAKAIVGETLSEGLPQINGNLDLTNNYKVQKIFFPAEVIPVPDGAPPPEPGRAT